MSRLGLATVAFALALVLVGCGPSGGASCPKSGILVSGGGTSYATSYPAGLATSYEAANSTLPVYFSFETTTAGNYTGCVGTTATTNMAFDLWDLTSASPQLTCNEYTTDNPDERCSTVASGYPLSGSTTYYVKVYDYGPDYGGTFTLTVTKDQALN